MPTLARQRVEARKRRGHAWQGVGAIMLAAIPMFVPKSPALIALSLLVVFFVGIPAARFGYFDKPSRITVAVLLILHLFILVCLGWYIWPVIKILPRHVTFSGIAQERFILSAKNDTDSDAYLVTIPIQVSKGLDGKISADFTLARRETPPIAMRFAYCIGKDQFDYLIINLPHLQAGEAQSFTVFYSGGVAFRAVPKRVISLAEPIATNDGLGRFGTGGIDYVDRCHFMFGPPNHENTQ